MGSSYDGGRGLLYGGASYGAGDVLTTSEAAAACCGTSSWRDHAGWVPHALRDVGGAAPEARLQTQTCEVLRVPLDAVYTVGPDKAVQVPTTSFPSGFLLLSCYAWGAAPGGGAAAAVAGAWVGREVYVIASSTHIPTAAAALSCDLQF